MQTTRYLFSKSLRLNKASEFKDLFRLGKKLSCRYFAIYIKPNNLSYARLGIVVAKKAVRLAANRNKIKRAIRENFRLNQMLVAGYDILVVGYDPINTLDKIELRQILNQQWKKLLSSCVKFSSV